MCVCVCLTQHFAQDIKTVETTKSVCSDDRGLWVTFASVGAAVSQWPHQLCKQLVFCIWRSGWDNPHADDLCLHTRVFLCVCVFSSWLSDVLPVVLLHNCEVLQLQHFVSVKHLVRSGGRFLRGANGGSAYRTIHSTKQNKVHIR